MQASIENVCCEALLDDLERLAASLGAWSALVEAVDAVAADDNLDPVSAVELGLKVAGWAANNVGDPVKAEAMYRKVLDKDPSHMEALVALEALLKGLGALVVVWFALRLIDGITATETNLLLDSYE